MNSAQYRTLREACGLSQQAAADFHGVATRTIAHWETGRNNIPTGAARELRSLNALIEQGVDQQMALYRELLAECGAPEAVSLLRYRSAEDYCGSRAHREGLTWPAHCALVARAMLTLERAGATTMIVWG